MEQKIIVFLDSIQRTIIATLVSDTKTSITVSKPAILNVAPTNEKKLQVQLYPLMFREFFKNRDSYPTWTYSKDAVVVSDGLDLEENLTKQYNEMFLPTVKNEPAPTIKLFDADSK